MYTLFDMKEKSKKRLGEILIEDGALSRENLQEALKHQKTHGGLIGQNLIGLGYVTEENLVAALGRQLHMPYLPLANYSLNMDAARRLEAAFCRRQLMIMFDEDERHMYLADADPLNTNAIEEAERHIKLKSEVFISTPTEIMNMLDIAFSPGSQTEQIRKVG